MTASTRSPHTTPERQTARTGLKVFGILMVAASLAQAAIVPYSLTLTGAAIPDARAPSAVRTASSEQVRRPISAAGLDSWKAYEPWLQPLKDALGPLAGPAAKAGAGPE